MSAYLGIDPGTTGAMALLRDPCGPHQLRIEPTPVLWQPKGTGKVRRYNLPALWALIEALPTITLAYVEHQGARPGQGLSSTFQTGFGAGIWQALLTAAGIPFVVITPQRWRRLVGLPVGPAAKSALKQAVRLAAVRRFPGQPIRLEHADAVMLAVAAMRDRGPASLVLPDVPPPAALGPRAS